jgi:phi13 family phage major tail protein
VIILTSEKKKYKASTGVDEFTYAPLDETGENTIIGTPQRVEFLQNITVEMPQEPVRAYGDNKTAEIAVSSGNTSVTSSFHKVPEQDKHVLFGLEKSDDGLYAYGSTDTPPYVAVMFAKTYEDGSKEYVGLPKGMFMRPNIEGKSKEDKVDFSSEEITAEFMDRKVEGFEEEKTVIFGRDDKGSTVARDAVYKALFGIPHPNAKTTP